MTDLFIKIGLPFYSLHSGETVSFQFSLFWHQSVKDSSTKTHDTVKPLTDKRKHCIILNQACITLHYHYSMLWFTFLLNDSTVAQLHVLLTWTKGEAPQISCPTPSLTPGYHLFSETNCMYFKLTLKHIIIFSFLKRAIFNQISGLSGMFCCILFFSLWKN